MAGLADKIVSILAEQGVTLPDVEWKIQRCRPSANQRSCGAWSWHLWPVFMPRDIGVASEGLKIGSIYPASLCVRRGFSLYDSRSGDTELFPNEVIAPKEGKDA